MGGGKLGKRHYLKGRSDFFPGNSRRLRLVIDKGQVKAKRKCHRRLGWEYPCH